MSRRWAGYGYLENPSSSAATRPFLLEAAATDGHVRVFNLARGYIAAAVLVWLFLLFN
jgi:hypothetical protein